MFSYLPKSLYMLYSFQTLAKCKCFLLFSIYTYNFGLYVNIIQYICEQKPKDSPKVQT